MALLAFGLLFVLPSWVGYPSATGDGGHGDHLWFHLQGMYVAFAVSAGFIVYFVQRLRQALAERERELALVRDLAERQAKFAALATVAAGAAHELGTPLSTIAVAARELECTLAREAEFARADIRLIRDQVRRCQHILQQMSGEAGQEIGEHLEAVRIEECAEAVVKAGLASPAAVCVEISPELKGATIHLPRRAINRALGCLLRNAEQASAPGRSIHLRFFARAGWLVAEVEDAGTGMEPAVLARAAEPFFTTKAPGEGIGLGLFLARSTARQLGGDLELESTAGAGTRARLVLPLDDARKSRAGQWPTPCPRPGATAQPVAT